MNFLLDTNAISEWVKPRPNPGLIGWMESADEDRIFLGAVSLAELRYSVERMATGSRRTGTRKSIALLARSRGLREPLKQLAKMQLLKTQEAKRGGRHLLGGGGWAQLYKFSRLI